MTTLVNRTLPGINAMTVSTFPPSALAGAGFDGILSFSVFSHLSEQSHTGWAEEFGRLVRPGGFAAVTVLDHTFFDSVRGAQREVASGTPSEFATNLAKIFPDVEDVAKAFKNGQFQFAQVGQDGARDAHHYGWAASPLPFLETTWGRAGFGIVEYRAGERALPAGAGRHEASRRRGDQRRPGGGAGRPGTQPDPADARPPAVGALATILSRRVSRLPGSRAAGSHAGQAR